MSAGESELKFEEEEKRHRPHREARFENCVARPRNPSRAIIPRRKLIFSRDSNNRKSDLLLRQPRACLKSVERLLNDLRGLLTSQRQQSALLDQMRSSEIIFVFAFLIFISATAHASVDRVLFRFRQRAFCARRKLREIQEDENVMIEINKIFIKSDFVHSFHETCKWSS